MYLKSASKLSSQLLNIAYKTKSKFVDINTIKKEAKILVGEIVGRDCLGLI